MCDSDAGCSCGNLRQICCAQDTFATTRDCPLPPGAKFRIGSCQLRNRTFASSSVFSSDGTQVLSADLNGEVRCFAAPTWEMTRSVDLGRSASVSRIAVSHDGKLLAVGVAGGIDLFNLPGWKHEKLIETTPFAKLDTLAFSKDDFHRRVEIVPIEPSKHGV